MARILIDARCLADPKSGGVARAARIWIKRKIQESPRDEFHCFTTGLKPSETVTVFCRENGLAYRHLNLPNKICTLLFILGILSLDALAEKCDDRYDRILLPNIGFMGRLKKPYTLLIHDLSFMIEPRWFNWKQRLWHKSLPLKVLIEKAERLECVSHQTRNDALRGFHIDSEKCHVIRPMDQALSVAKQQKPEELREGEGFVLLLGESDERKNIMTALRAIEVHNDSRPNDKLKAVIIGGKKKRTDGVHLHLPRVTDDELQYLYAHARALLYPSWYEGFGLPLHEAHRFNTTIIASCAGALPETAPPETIFCHPAKPHEWLKALENFVIKKTAQR